MGESSVIICYLEGINIVFTRVLYKMEGNWIRGWGSTCLVVGLTFSSCLCTA